MTPSPESRARFIVKVLDTARSNVFPSEAEIAEMMPHVDGIRARYAELRGRDFYEAYLTSRSEFIAAAIREAENEALERARLIAANLVPWPFPASEVERVVSNTACSISIEIERIKHRHQLKD